MRILHNHLGYLPRSRKRALVQTSGALPGQRFTLYDSDRCVAIFEGSLQLCGGVSGWRDWQYWEADFSSVTEPGRYVLAVDGASPAQASRPFEISASLYDGQLVSDLVHYLKSQRCTGIFDRADLRSPKHGSEERVDVHGGWYDASGDTSKYLSHLSYANFMNPQQTPQVVWNLIDGRARMPEQSAWLDERILDEALHGADFLVRMQDPAGYFYLTVFDRWTKDPAQREICDYATQQGQKLVTYQAGYRQGAGSAIAALARASQLPRGGEHERVLYLAAAERGLLHLQSHNLEYLNDHEENIVDDYCALLAAVELFAATAKGQYREAAELRAARLIGRQAPAGWFWANDDRSRSYFHAAEAGLPYLALLRFLAVLPDASSVAAVREALRRALSHELDITFEGQANPFGYPRQYVAMPGKTAAVQFFVPHENESGYWWQGENARLASLASAAHLASAHFTDHPTLASRLLDYTQAALDWIFGSNPFDACMMQGIGHNNPRYEEGFWNAPGGVCNGITAGLLDERDIDFRMPKATEPGHSWRWSEQWIPHGAWLFHALAQRLPAGLDART